jgi:hypothetical protein
MTRLAIAFWLNPKMPNTALRKTKRVLGRGLIDGEQTALILDACILNLQVQPWQGWRMITE